MYFFCISFAQLFELFDDVLLLGKGGSTVYLGPSSACQEYFDGLGFAVPDRVNPADFFMDVIAGKHERKGHPDFEPKDLWPLWDDGRKAREIANPTSPVRSQQIKLAQMKEACPIGFFHSFLMFAGRTLLQYSKHRLTFVADIAMQLVAGAVVGGLHTKFEFFQMTTMNFMLGLIVGLTTSLAELRVFGGEREVFWRESSPGSGMNLNTLSYFLAKTVVELARIAVLVTAILLTFYPLASPRTYFADYFKICYAGALMATGVPIIFSTSINPKSAQLATVIFVLIVNMLAGNQPTLGEMDKMGKGVVYFSRMSYARWFDEALFVSEVALYSDAWKMPPTFLKGSDSVVARLVKLNYTEEMQGINIMVMIYLAIIFRIVAYLGLIAFNRDKRSLPSFYDIIVEDIFTPLRDLAVDLTMMGSPAQSSTSLGASIRKGLGVTVEEEERIKRELRTVAAQDEETLMNGEGRGREGGSFDMEDGETGSGDEMGGVEGEGEGVEVQLSGGGRKGGLGGGETVEGAV